ncbi:DUF1570 domain-containing protein [Thalassoroseus pseudoceratinae]|uniref:DUF1570 domain-containing protein n=1 Tax=Thalassoroseus pseudoceratinae TaxID=2713176 RepID=UPI001421D5CF|nr:DUF1570 domain-containing protein [Thalassoroseus pseudoceratinae]
MTRILSLCFVILYAGSLRAAELVQVEFQTAADQPTTTATGRILVEAQDGGMLLQTPTAEIVIVPGENLESKDTVGEFQSATAEELGRAMLAELGVGFRIHATEHYVIASDANRDYTADVGQLFERLYTAFQEAFESKAVTLTKSEFPLAVVLFADQKDFAQYATAENGPVTAQSQGYYSARSNRIILYDLSRNSRSRSVRANALRTNAATIIHEATHQIAFNRGLHTRYADNPLWFTEGLAMQFETFDPRTRNPKRTIGLRHRHRLQQFLDYARQRRPRNSLETLIATNDRFVDPKIATDAYAEAWALTYFLMHEKRDEYEKYLESIAKLEPLMFRSSEEHVQVFQKYFGDDLESLDREFLRVIRRLAAR